LTDKWNRDPNFNYERFSTSHQQSIDEEIDRLQYRPGYVERLLERILGSRSKEQPDRQTRPVSHAEAFLAGADFTRQRLESADFRAANLQRAVFTGAELRGSLFCDADLRGANLAEAVLSGSDMRGADLSGANLIGADVSGANLRGANLQGAYLWGADFHDTDLHEALLDGAYAGGSMFSHARNLTLEQFRSTIHDETGAYRLSMLPDPPTNKSG
jgi:uncharacterized protein YjbI with pentapeptide repeats